MTADEQRTDTGPETMKTQNQQKTSWLTADPDSGRTTDARTADPHPPLEGGRSSVVVRCAGPEGEEFDGNSSTPPDARRVELRERVLETVRERTCFSKTELASWVRGGKGEVLRAIDSLLDDGTIAVFFDGSFCEVCQ